MAPKADKYVVMEPGKQKKGIISAEEKGKSIIYYDRRCGCCGCRGRVTSKRLMSSGDNTNRVGGVRIDEYKASAAARIGDKRGYAEYFKQEKFKKDDGNNRYKYGQKWVCDAGASTSKSYPIRYYDYDDDDDDEDDVYNEDPLGDYYDDDQSSDDEDELDGDDDDVVENDDLDDVDK